MTRKKQDWWDDRRTLRLRLGGFNSSARRYGHKSISIAVLEKRMGAIKGIESVWRSCWACSRPLTKRNVSFDHRIPLANRGEHSLDNLVIACRPCNLKRGSEDADWWYEFMQWLASKGKVAWFHKMFRRARWRTQ